MFLRLAALLICALFSTLSKSQATVHRVDTIVDDNDPSIVYDSNPSGPWVTNSSLSWDITKLYRGTFHRGDYNAHAQYIFNGTGVKVVIATGDASTNISFFLDGTKQGEYIRRGTKANKLRYNITAFETSALSNSSHVLDIVGGQGKNNTMYLDYIQYTPLLLVSASSTMSSSSATAITSTPTSSGAPDTSSTPPRISIAGLVGIGLMVGVIALLLANLAIWIHRRKKKATKRPRSSEIAILKFHQDASLPRGPIHDASYSQRSFEASNTPRGEYTLPQTPSASLVRGVRI